MGKMNTHMHKTPEESNQRLKKNGMTLWYMLYIVEKIFSTRIVIQS